MSTSKDKGTSVSTADAEDQADEAAGNSAALARTQEDAAGDVSGQLTLANFSDATRDAMTKELLEAIHRVESGFDALIAPGIILKQDQPFYVIDAMTVEDYVDRASGEVKTKHIFRLKFADGLIKTVMQSDAAPRAVLANAFRLARQLGGSMEAGPYKYAKKRIQGQIQEAIIFEQQSGFAMRAV